ncbi:MAG: hypothetical protein UV74_C0013G0536 [Candidatus Woesebacteria bacterium GW2011_GWB1_43_14]|uniref:Sortase family protein n=1 Tax=Candidatus Woesebacteria bacterium GW2011_GWB1_43_14 TaxID=1618578 RepID=A0A0G1DIB1_9BACT|nr:MAG: hypothetical protein UT21_C0001G0249 [Candidatus Woesebacteria bacterium GW2011_GWA1_39_11b]KKS78005.1 MAG: hypothetical protein UV51_C0003G0040 [Candidatus Woesebacteria bacterium GW2011_GWC1_42_9]KKS97414.1 MAG: hypothetical protein UV74_C0013G0536 [Candidatus Woesebacteria bacterium GW2011_GWB1_43_14]
MRTGFYQRIIGGAGIALGILVLGYILLPIITYELEASRFTSYLSPVPKKEIDFTRLSNWFSEDVVTETVSPLLVDHYTISIPSLGIKDASVAIGGEDLSKSLIQYPGTALPGKPGNSVIFGHSILPQFYNPDDYMTIFSTLPTMEIGDEIQVFYDGAKYYYKVEDMFEVSPNDIQVLEQNLSDSFVTLVTCTPPGHPLRPKRLIVRARVVSI